MQSLLARSGVERLSVLDACSGGSLMQTAIDRSQSRRRFLKFLAGSPLLALWGPGSIEELLATAFQRAPALIDPPLKNPTPPPEQALGVFVFEPVARQALPPAHWGYMATGVDDDATLQANRSAFAKFQ